MFNVEYSINNQLLYYQEEEMDMEVLAPNSPMRDKSVIPLKQNL